MVFDQIMTFLAVNRVSLYYNGRRAMSCLWHVNCTFFFGGGVLLWKPFETQLVKLKQFDIDFQNRQMI